MGEGKTTTEVSSKPIDMDTHEGDAASTYGANTNLDPHMQGGPVNAEDQAAADEIERQHQQQGTPAPEQ
ncbi:hypothetical protein [Deinococcus arenicola]|uniref:M-like protein n=1 Tax=Deinococcus arenicola TaxID=2994950 RepID=A0ABU4DUA2_9DEIO|nr:hypothetical protein [Deinococcus sp. ZS9-10]MDV6375958.1 hypothetical protein [Deinococcus sp. ZS9-10]